MRPAHQAARVAAAVLALAACGPTASPPPPPPAAEGHAEHAAHLAAAPDNAGDDSSFARLQERGRAAMGVDQYTSQHVFEPLPDGGRIVLRRDPADSAGTATIRAHMREIAAAFARGDFSTPGMVHAGVVPGTDVMRERHDRLRYEARDLPGGAEVRITTADAEALRAVHAFLAYQRRDHRAGAGT